VVVLNAQSGKVGGGAVSIKQRPRNKGWYYQSRGDGVEAIDNYGDTGGASRFFYCSKASSAERGEGNSHPTVKPLELLRYLVRLTKTPHGGLVFDPFMGSGSTGKAALLEGRGFVGIELEAEYFNIAKRRIEEAKGCVVK